MPVHEATIAERALRPGVVPTLVGVTLAAWLLVIVRMRGMDAGPGTDLGSAGWYLGIWVTMMAAMMLPSATPMVLLFSKVASGSTDRAGLATGLFVTGYLIVWTGFGLVAYGLFRLVRGLDPSFLAWEREGPVVAGAAIVLAGIYQLTPMKRACLRHCRTPLSFVMHHWRSGSFGGAADGDRARSVVRGLLLGADGRPLRGRGDEHHVDGRPGGDRVRREDASGRRARGASGRRRADRVRYLGGGRPRQRPRLDPPRHGDGDGVDAAVPGRQAWAARDR